MVRIEPKALKAIIAALDDYKEETLKSKLQQTSKQTYLLHANNFVRWLEGDFTPGGTL